MSGRVIGTDTYEDLVDALVALELPGLPTERRDQTVGFASRRLQNMASPIRVALQLSSVALGAPVRIVGAPTVMRSLMRTALPFVSDIPRAMRYLVVSYVWETWPDTQPDGAPGARHVTAEVGP